MTPDQRAANAAKFKVKNETRKAARRACPETGRRAEARALRRMYGGIFGKVKFSPEGGLGDLIVYGTSAA